MKILSSQTDEMKIRESFSKTFFNWRKRIVKVAKFDLPCYLFELEFRSSNKVKRLYVICDAHKGKVRRVDWPRPCHSITGNLEKFSLDEAQALKRVKEEFRWFSFSSGMRGKRKYHLEEVMSLGCLGYPFWIIYYKRRGRYNFSVYDALSGKKEDFFTRDIFLGLFGLKENSF